jgi:hypothetical protein
MNHIFGFLLILTILLISGMAWESDWVQQKVNAEKFWNDKVSHYEGTVEFYQNDVHSCWLELRKLSGNLNIEAQQHILSGLAADAAVELYISHVQLTVEMCDFSQQQLQKAYDELETAKQMLSGAITQ